MNGLMVEYFSMIVGGRWDVVQSRISLMIDDRCNALIYWFIDLMTNWLMLIDCLIDGMFPGWFDGLMVWLIDWLMTYSICH